MDTLTNISIPPETLDLLEATALANQCTAEEIIRAAIEAFLESDRGPEDAHQWPDVPPVD
jgi:hypothetical protein